MRKIPPADYRPEYLDRQVIFDVELPDGAAHGPVIDRLELADGLDEAQLIHIFETFHDGWDYEEPLRATLDHFRARTSSG